MGHYNEQPFKSLTFRLPSSESLSFLLSSFRYTIDMSRSNNRARGRANNTGAKSMIARLKSSLHGHENQLRHIAPPPFNRKPYNTLTVERVYQGQGGTTAPATSDMNCTLADLVGAIRNQLDMAGADPICFKIRRIDVF